MGDLTGQSYPKVERWSRRRFWVDTGPDDQPDNIDLSEPMQAALAGSQVFDARDGGLLISGYVGDKTIEGLRRRGVVEKFSSGLTPLGEALVALLRGERA